MVVRYFRLENWKMRATFLWLSGRLRTPKAVLTTVGHSDVMKITNRVAVSTEWAAARPMGNHARGETGRRIWAMGSRTRRDQELRPSSIPRGMAAAAPKEKPMNTRRSEAAN